MRSHCYDLTMNWTTLAVPRQRASRLEAINKE